ncbi:MAG TPA: response regulator [Aggregatilineales bacterium]|nr:response regulator [Aggregatilineales bacterium]
MSTILLVEDTLDMQMLLRDLLVLDGHEVLLARTGAEGVEVLRDCGDLLPDLIISDANMPIMDGYELLEVVRSEPQWAHLRFVMMTANVADERLALLSGLDGIFPKPFSLDELRVALGVLS